MVRSWLGCFGAGDLELNREIDQHKKWDIGDVDPKRRGGGYWVQEDGKEGLVQMEGGILEEEGLAITGI